MLVGQLLSFSIGRDINITRHYFLHIYLSANPKCVYFASIPEDMAQTLDIGILPSNKGNVANFVKREYFLAPNTKKGNVKSVVDMLHRKGRNRKYCIFNRICF